MRVCLRMFLEAGVTFGLSVRGPRRSTMGACVFACVCMCACVRVCMYACVRVCVDVCVYLWVRPWHASCPHMCAQVTGLLALSTRALETSPGEGLLRRPRDVFHEVREWSKCRLSGRVRG
eukprot:GHVU01024259.1.p3 GENE.GHVU01024259.1~~GHVU01024259.1.p3  ORF type:complete len:120 (+),score=2.92 GHVU01024259.1:398-757(+)